MRRTLPGLASLTTAIAVLACASLLPLRARAQLRKPSTALLVDKKTNTLHLEEYVDGAFREIKSYHVTLGKVAGDKEDEGDLKTPEGIYTFKSKSMPPRLAAKFGVMAFDVDFPNAYDRLAGHTGSNIMLHATNEPERLSKDYDSLGCVVVRNDEIQALAPYIRIGLTPIMIFSDLTDDYLKPGQGPEGDRLKAFFESWIKAWESKDIDSYIAHYHSDFHEHGMDLAHYRAYKASLNKRYATISVTPEDVMYYRHPKYSMITFTQDYRSKLKSGAWGHRSRGTKILYVAEEGGQPKIIAETYTTLTW